MFQEMLLSENQSYSKDIAPIVIPSVVKAGYNMPVLTIEPQDQVSKPKNNSINSIIGSPKSSAKQVRAHTAFNYFSEEMYPMVHTQFPNLKKKGFPSKFKTHFTHVLGMTKLQAT